MDAIKYVEEQISNGNEFPSFRPGDNVAVSIKIVEGDKERVQIFRGDVLQIKGTGITKTFTVRRIASGVGVERIFPFNSPAIVKIEILKYGKVRRAKLYYLRKFRGKKARIKERPFTKK